MQFNPEGLRVVEEAAGSLKPLVQTHQTSEQGVIIQKSVQSPTREPYNSRDFECLN